LLTTEGLRLRPSKSTAKTRENEIVSVVRFRLEPTKEQEQKLLHTFYLCRTLYNKALEERFTPYREKRISIRYTDQQNRLSAWKQGGPEYKPVHSQVLQSVFIWNTKAKNASKQLIKVPSHHTSQLCSGDCGTLVKSRDANPEKYRSPLRQHREREHCAPPVPR
jgi:hypothetical protein